jgi:hypothetical protein
MHSALDEVVPLTRVGGQVGLVHVIAKRARTCYPPSFPPIARQFGGKLAKLTNALQSLCRGGHQNGPGDSTIVPQTADRVRSGKLAMRHSISFQSCQRSPDLPEISGRGGHFRFARH